MRELAQWVFLAGQGETVAIRVVPRESEAGYVGVWLDDRRLEAEPNPLSYPYLVYSFQVRRPAGQSHIIKLECNFSLTAPPTARYDLWISGSQGSGEFLRTVNRDDERDVDIIFSIGPEVVDEAAPGTPRKRQRPEVVTEGAPERGPARGRREIVAEVAPEVRQGPRRGIRPEVATEVRPEVLTEIAPEIKPEVKPEVVTESETRAEQVREDAERRRGWERGQPPAGLGGAGGEK